MVEDSDALDESGTFFYEKHDDDISIDRRSLQWGTWVTPKKASVDRWGGHTKVPPP